MNRFVSRALGAFVVACAALGLQPTHAADAINVSIAVFDPGVPADQSLHRDLGIFPRIREIEAKLLPFALRESLAKSSGWGAIRVIPEAEGASELLVTGQIGQSDGLQLEVFIRAVDARGIVWIEKTYAGRPGGEALYRRIANDLAISRDALDGRTLDRIVEVSLLRYGNELAPSAFGEFLQANEDGTWTIVVRIWASP